MILEIKNLSKIYSQGETKVEALRNIHFTMPEGKTLSVVGPSGSGKTTLLSLIAGLETPTTGEIIFLGEHLEKMNEKDLCRFRAQNLGIVFQQFHLMPHLTALENVLLPLEIIDRKNPLPAAQEALEKVGLKNRHHHLPEQLSGGERQRVAIARAMIAKPKLILADEPSGNLDTKTGALVMDLLFEQVRQSQTNLILITHDHSLAKRCDSILELEGGMIQ